MKKILSLVMALTMVLGLNAAPVALKQLKASKTPSVALLQKQKVLHKAPMAATVIFAPADFADKGTEGTGSAISVTKDGVTVATDKGYGHRTYNPDTEKNDGAPDQLRVYKGGKLTISATSTITKIKFTFADDKDGGLSESYTPNKTSWSETLGSQARITAIEISLDGDTPTPPTPSGDVEIKGLAYADAYYIDGYWDFDIYADDATDYFPEVYFSCYDEAPSQTSIVGTYDVYWAGYWASENDSVLTADEAVGSLTVTCVEQGVYNFVGSLEGEDGKTYTWNAQNIEVQAWDDEYNEITLTDGGTPTPPTPGDTTALTTLDTFEFGYYASYSEEGAYNYSLNIYNSQDENYVPYVSFDIYTEAQNEFTGKFSAEGGNLGLDYSAFFPDAESEGEYFTSATVTITEGEGDDLVIEGIFTTEAGATYTFSVTAEPYIYDAEHPYEPQEAKTFDLTAVDGKTDDTYFADYGIAYFYLDMEDGSYVGLTYRTANGTEPEGTFSILDDENEDAFLTGADYYGYPDGSYYETIDGDVYYFVSGSVTLATDDIGNTNITINATSAYGSTFTVTGTVPAPQPTPGHTIVFADYAEEDLENFTTLDGAYTVATDKNGGTEPAYNTNGEDLRLYAKNKMTLTKNTKDGPMTEITFNISTKGLTRQAEIAVSTGEIVIYDMDNAIVVWKGEASEVTFTVGDKNVYGSDGKDKAGQFDFTSLDVEGGVTGLISTKVNKVASKCLINGQLMIIKNDAIYNFQGNLVK